MRCTLSGDPSRLRARQGHQPGCLPRPSPPVVPVFRSAQGTLSSSRARTLRRRSTGTSAQRSRRSRIRWIGEHAPPAQSARHHHRGKAAKQLFRLSSCVLPVKPLRCIMQGSILRREHEGTKKEESGSPVHPGEPLGGPSLLKRLRDHQKGALQLSLRRTERGPTSDEVDPGPQRPQPSDKEPLLPLRTLVLLTITAGAVALIALFPAAAIPAGVGIGILTLLHNITGR
jgi:hypothetical protein